MANPRAGRHRIPIVPRATFVWHVLGYVLIGAGFLVLSLAVGILGYHHFAGLDWVDAFLNSSMILTGMGPVSALPTDRAKIFASIYAIVSGAAYPAVMAIVLYPFLHRMLAILHLQSLGEEHSGDGEPR